MITSQALRLSLALLIITLVAAFAITMAAQAETTDAPTIPTWPPFTMEYETDGIVYSVGSSDSVTTREVRRLEYTSATQWTDTVIEAPTITTSVGSESRVGSTSQLNGSAYTEFNASGETTYTDTIGERTTLLAGSLPQPFPLVASGVATVAATTTAKVCFYEECMENAAGVLYRKASGSEMVFVDDARGIPLRVNDGLVVKEIRINDAKQPIVR